MTGLTITELPVKARSMGSHQSAAALSDNWLTPLSILAPLGKFDLDPSSAPPPRPWPTAHVMWTREADPLGRRWAGRVWLNPPFGPRPLVTAFVRKMAEHGHGIALLAARTETNLWSQYVWPHTSGILFLEKRLHFARPDGSTAPFNSGVPIALIAYGAEDAEVLRCCSLRGTFARICDRPNTDRPAAA